MKIGPIMHHSFYEEKNKRNYDLKVKMNPLLAHTPLCCISFLILLKIKCIEKKININNQIITIFVFIFWVVFILGPSLFFGLSLFYRLHSIIGWSSFLGCLHF